MAAVYTDITIEELDTYLKRAFRALRPKQIVCKSEYCYLLSLSPNVRIQILTAISRGASSSRDVGTDTIKLMLVGDTSNRPLLAGKKSSLSMKRTQGWKTTLQDRIEDLVELYEERKDYWEQRAGGTLKTEEDLQEEEDTSSDSLSNSEPPSHQYNPSQLLSGVFVRDRQGAWAAKIYGTGVVGAKALLETKAGRKVPVILVKKMWGGVDRYTDNYSETWSIEETRKASVDRVIGRFLSKESFEQDVHLDAIQDFEFDE